MTDQTTTSIEAGHETTDADAGPLLKIAFAMAALVIVSFVGMVVMFKVLAYYQPMLQGVPHALNSTRVETLSEPLLETDAPRQRLALRAQEDEKLNGYSLDAETGVAQIPIKRAIDLIAERGLPVKTGSGAAGQ
ncbi:MAG: hypothetical protein HOM68_24950 [Gemmatimonadetes bacterium]|jgi:hypothetical protein|nr:hypothetical protein [Gemmatimonadota bacterium]MBT5059819.1 hypothetical protein [Gemmatimonadota bacterium]MBT5141861.1 hypothetical protein [Gemmatimonadota bacterium]MBT5589850.1 hypothetical protein [Gemmatimonadota bacterium]MBT5963974.1 hypothetical protein [Gemmatimonadota bacterium]